jgi:FSR family fosmidomycin resistance protein-like MFS transporter
MSQVLPRPVTAEALAPPESYAPRAAGVAGRTVFPVILALAASHLLNDMIQAVLPALYPMLKGRYGLSFAQIGVLTLAFQMTASLLQPAIGLYTDRRPMPYSLPLGMGFTLLGLVLLAHAGSFAMLLAAAALVGVGSSVFHPEASRMARLASGGRHGLAQSIFQVGGNAGQAIGPLAAAFVVIPHGQGSVAWFVAGPLLAMGLLGACGAWYSRQAPRGPARAVVARGALPPRRVALAVGVLVMLVFSKYFYLASLTSYYTFYLIARFHLSVQAAQVHLFVFLAAVAAGTLAGGPIGDRIGRRRVIWSSILGVLPFTLMLPHASLAWTSALSVVIGLILASAFSAILLYAQDLLPGKVGLVGGLFFGLAFGLGGIGAAVLGLLADATSIGFVYALCAWLPAIGLLAVLLPDLDAEAAAKEGSQRG